MKHAFLLVFIGLSFVTCRTQPPASGTQNRLPSATTYQNPILNEDFADPTVINTPDGWYYAYATQSKKRDKFINIQVARSRNLRDWQRLPDALPQRPIWASTTQDFWAPHVVYNPGNQTYIMYFSGESDAKDVGKCLGIAVASQPEGPFKPLDEPLLCGEGFVNIDPMAFRDPASAKLYLYWGSGFQAIKVRELRPDGLAFAPGSAAQPVVFPGKDSTYSRLIEGAWLTHKNDYYYLYYSGDNCCGDKANYAVMVARSGSPTGPFVRLGEANGTGKSAILEKNSVWNAPGHNSIVADQSGQEWIIYHAIPRQRADSVSTGRVMLMDPVQYDRNGWPYIESGQPSVTPQPMPVVR